MPILPSSVGQMARATTAAPTQANTAETGRAFASTLSRAIDAVRSNTRPIDPREAVWEAPRDEPRTRTYAQTTRATRGI